MRARVACVVGPLWLGGCAASASQAELVHLQGQVQALLAQSARTDARLTELAADVGVLAVSRPAAAAAAGPPLLPVVHLPAVPAAQLQALDEPAAAPTRPARPPRVLTMADLPASYAAPATDAAPGPGGAGRALLARAYASYQRGDAAAAERAFATFVRAYPDDPEAGSAAFWLGECHLEAGAYAAAVADFSRVPQGEGSPKAGEALLKMGLAYEKLQQQDRATRCFARLVAGYPDSAPAELARARLGRRAEDPHGTP